MKATSEDPLMLGWNDEIGPFFPEPKVPQGLLACTTTSSGSWSSDESVHTTSSSNSRSRSKINKSINYAINEGENKDFINHLPNDILVYVLSFLEMKTAAKTSLVSRRWRYVWTLITDLDFDFDPMHRPCWFPNQSELDAFKRRVYQVIAANRAPYLNTFRIRYALYETSSDDIDKWVAFVVTKKIYNLELNFSTTNRVGVMNGYVLRKDLLSTNCFGSLKSLHLEALCMEGSVFEYVLSNSINLERLIVWMCSFYPRLPVGVQLVVSCMKLKHLVLCRCYNIKSFKISAPELTVFTCYTSKEVEVEYCCVPSLVSVTFGGSYCCNIFQKLPVFSDFSHQLEKLSLHWGSELYEPSGFPCFRSVKHLEFAINDNRAVDADYKLIALISLIEACPLLHTFELELQRWYQPSKVPISGEKDKLVKAIRAHKHLRTVKFVGYTGTTSAAELALCLAEHAPMLNKFIFDPRSPSRTIFPERIFNTDETVDRIELGRRRAEFLAYRIRRVCGVDVVIL